VRAAFLSHVGAVRENNEDAVYCDRKAGHFIVADGLGGKSAGEVASATAVHIAAEHLWAAAPGEDPCDVLREAFYQANDLLFRKGRRYGASGMGTTMTAAVCNDDEITVVHVGDSRAYLLNRSGIRQLTDDHSWVAQLMREGKLTPEEARVHPRRNILTRALGQDTLTEVDTFRIPWQQGDILLLCSDGLYNMMEDWEMLEIVQRCAVLDTAVEYLADTAYRRGGFDNISVLLAAHD